MYSNSMVDFLNKQSEQQWATQCHHSWQNSEWVYEKWNFKHKLSKIWIRYVDTIFAIIDKDFNVDEFVKTLNAQYTYSLINFTYETEIIGELPFLRLFKKKRERKLKIQCL